MLTKTLEKREKEDTNCEKISANISLLILWIIILRGNPWFSFCLSFLHIQRFYKDADIMDVSDICRFGHHGKFLFDLVSVTLESNVEYSTSLKWTKNQKCSNAVTFFFNLLPFKN